MNSSSGTYVFTGPARIVFGRPAGDAVREAAERLGARRVLLVGSASQARLAAAGHGPLHAVQAALGARHAGTFTALRAHSPHEDVLAGARLARDLEADLLVGIGGGSVLDGTKAMLACRWHGIEDSAALGALTAQPPGALTAPAGALRMLSVSTMLSAADFTGGAGVTDTTTNTKQALHQPLLAPETVVLDPAATLDTPLPLLLASGMRSVDHAIEGYCSPLANAVTRLHALAGLRWLVEALPRIQGDPASLDARGQAQLGMWQAMTGASTGAGTGASHGIGYGLGAGFGVTHGHTSCVLLPAVLRWNAAVNAADQQALAQAWGRPDVPLADLVADLVRQLGQPGTLSEVGVTPADWPALAVRALAYPPVQQNPRPIRSADDVLEILALADGAQTTPKR